MNPIQAKLLIVDDCGSMREILRELMNDLNIVNIDEASDGRAGLAMFQSNPYDLVLSDWNMPFMTGLELLRGIRRSTQRSQTPLLLLSGDLTIKHTVEALASGVTGVLEKPFSVPKLCEQVRRIIASLSPSSEYRHAPRAERVLRAQV
jgi:two-component system, chemotaxis family, chemotaxis protein CheY